ncbi:MAG: DUF839 domain-containing protein [Gemmatales bacterium]|nr:DUF839 domain-containing protein [Gemmatales bacterium]
MNQPLSRRNFLQYVGWGSYAVMRDWSRLVQAQAAPSNRPSAPPPFFKPIAPSTEDQLILPDGYRYQLLAVWGDSLGSRGPYGEERVGSDCDFLAYFPIDALQGGRNPNEGLLWINHENCKPLFASGYDGTRRTEEQVIQEKLQVGGTVLHIRREAGRWHVVKPSPYNRRLTALYPEIRLTGPVAERIPVVQGTLANCSGGRSPWWTALSCEENFHWFNRFARDPDDDGYGWQAVPSQAIDETHYGWVVEVDPFGQLPPVKHSALGRFAHENLAWRLGATGRLVCYMGDDSANQYFYKYVSVEPLRSGMTRQEQRRLLERGTLYVADFLRQVWIPLDVRRNRKLQEAGFRTQADVLLETRKAAKAAGATPLDRPEDCEVHPADGSVYLALTNSVLHGNLFGQIIRLVEDKDDAESESFRFEIFLVGGAPSGLACPDNLCFDRRGNLWVACDISHVLLNRWAYRRFGNNGIYVVPTRGESAGDAFQFASGPVEAELTGPWFAEDYSCLFLSVQHPGEGTRSLDNPTSHWPHGGRDIPRSAVVVIDGFPAGW